ncbi:dentin sialophosphoprotein-like [Quillaja saponaria]|uniref:Dentin sialophosphoprotein-like n=1 Tax=Quillaja saponaria TaxID=32244 RepID=A0AAD7QEG6_QUISA|nr:dentin sialophosphoprotein-like [Quillaja saponaria]
MGNNNTSGVKDDVKGENQISPTDQGKDVQGKAAELVSDDATIELQKDLSEENIITAAEGNNVKEKAAKLASDEHTDVEDSCRGRMQEETEVRKSEQTPPAAIDAGGGNCEIQSTNSFNDVEDCQKQTKSCLEENLMVTSDSQLEEERSNKQEEERTRFSTLDIMAISKVGESQESFDVHSNRNESCNLNAKTSVQDGSKSIQGDRHILGSNVIRLSDDSSNLQDSNISKDLGGSNISNSNPFVENNRDDPLENEIEKMSSAEKSDDRDGDDFGTVLEDVSEVTSDSPISVDKKCNDDSSEVNCNGNISLPLLPYNALDRHGDEFVNGQGDKSELTADSPSVSNNCNGDLSTEVNFPASLPHVNLFDNRLTSHQEVSDPEEKSVVLDKETNLIIVGLDTMNIQEYSSAQYCQELIKEPETDLENASQYEYSTIGSAGENNKKENFVDTSNILAISKKNQMEEANVPENGYQVDISIDNQTKDSEGETLMVPEPEMLPILAGSTVVDCKYDEGEQAKRKVVDEVNAEIEASYATEEFQNTNMIIPGAEQENDELFEIKDFALDSMNMIAPTIGSTVEKAFEGDGKDPSQHVNSTPSEVAEIASAVIMSTEPCLSPAFATSDYEAAESFTRLSNESNPDNLNTPAQIKKSPSFNIDLQIEARREESDRIPLLYQDKTEKESLSRQIDLSLVNVTPNTKCSQETLHYEAMPVEEKTVTSERSYSEKPKTPFLGFLKEEEKGNMLLTQQKQDFSLKEAATASRKGKEKRKHKSFLFSNCMCCGTVIN